MCVYIVIFTTGSLFLLIRTKLILTPFFSIFSLIASAIFSKIFFVISSSSSEKYVTLNLELVVDDFKIENKDLKNVNYNATFTHKKYFMVYDYELGKPENKYYYFRTRIDEKGEAELRLDGRYSTSMTQGNYSKTPNKKYLYMLIYTETLSEQNLDLIFMEYIENENGLTLQYETNENGNIEIDTEIIDKDVNVCKEYFINQWSNGELDKKEDLEFLFDVYNDLSEKLLK